jgi:hypothetical protein
MIKKWLGIRKIEELIKRFHSDTHNHWGHTQNLYKLNEENKREIAEIRQNLDIKTDRLLGFMNELIEKMERAEDRDVREIVPESSQTIDIDNAPERSF